MKMKKKIKLTPKREKQPKKTKMKKGGRNLVILGLASAGIAMVTTGISLAIYHNSGDIYLDRSRPGFLPDEAEVEEEENEKQEEYSFEKSGVMTMAGLEEYLKELEKEVQEMDSFKEPFGQKVLSNEQLGIPEK